VVALQNRNIAMGRAMSPIVNFDVKSGNAYLGADATTSDSYTDFRLN